MVEVNTAARSNNRVFRNLATLYGAQLITGILSLIPIAFLPRYLGVVGMGQLTLAISFTGIFSALMITGTTVYIVREIARDHQRLHDIVTSGVLLRASFAIALLPIALLTLGMMRYSEEIRSVVLIMYGAITIRMISHTFQAALQALEDMTWRSISVVASKIVAVSIGYLLLLQGGGIVGYVLVLVLADAVELAVNLAYFLFIVPIRPRIRWQSIRATFLGGMPFLWALLQTIYQQTASIMLSKLGSETAVGWFGTANQFIIPLFMIPSVAITVLLPQFSQLHMLEPGALRRAVARSMNYMTIITIPLAFGLAAIADRVLDLFGYPATFQNSVPVLRMLAFNLPAAALLMVAATAVAATNKERGWAKISLASVVLSITINALLIPLAETTLDNPAVGAASAALLAEALTLALAIRLLGGAVIDRFIFVTLGKTTLAGCAMAAVVLSLAWASLLLVIAAGALVYGGIVLLLNVLPGEDLQFVRRFIMRRWR